MEAKLSHSYEINPWMEKTVLNKWFWAVFCLFFFAYPLVKSVNRELPPPLPALYQLPDYELTNAYGESFGTKDLEGKVYIASFFFTSCPTTCPKIMKSFQKVQHRVRGLGTNIALVSFTVDPKNDTPMVLKKKAREMGANSHVWKFLTGPEEQMENIVVDGFKLAMGDPEVINGSMYDIAHSEKFVLVDGKGQIRGFYPSSKDGISKMMIDVGLLVNRPGA